jgi:hypothetical protein
MPEQAVLDSNNALKRGETYRVVIVGDQDGVKDADGTALASNRIWWFTVR